jgi:hypothetical protein
MAKAAERLREHFQKVAILDKDDPIADDLLNANKFLGSSSHDGNRYMYNANHEEIVVRDVSMLIERQW